MLTAPSNLAIVKAVIGLATIFNRNVIAEGVETAAQHQFLHENGCKTMQGFLFSKPLSVVACSALLKRSESLYSTR